MQTVALFAAVFAALMLVGRLRLWLVLRRGRYAPPEFACVADDAMPADLRALLDRQHQALVALGFGEATAVRMTSIDLREQDPQWALAAAHDGGETWALITPHLMPEAGAWAAVSFDSLDRDGRWHTTVDGIAHLLFADLPGSELHDPNAIAVAAQFRHHQAALPAREHRQALATADAYLAASAAFYRQAFAAWERSGVLARASAPAAGWTLRPAAAWRAVGRNQAGTMRRQKALLEARKRTVPARPLPGRPPSARQAGRAAVALEPVPALIDALAFRRHAIATQGGGGAGGQLALLALTLIGFLIVFPLVSGGAWTALPLGILVGVLLIHELGHLLTMRWCGYRDTSIFFVPGLGAAATGRKPDASVGERFAVLLMGPLPGLLIGCTLLVSCIWSGRGLGAIQEDPLAMTTWMLIALNLLNLLPVLPLDGGRIVDLLLFQRLAWGAVVVRVLTVAALVAAAVALGNDVALWLLATFLAFSLPNLMGRQRALRALRRADDLPRDDAVAFDCRIATAMQATSLATRLFAVRAQIAGELRDALGAPLPGVGQTIGLLAIYLAALVGVPLAAFAAMVAMRAAAG